jgi:ParB family chromosome partitioning protein
LAEVHAELNIQEAAWYGYQQNEERHQFCDLDRAMFYEKLIAQGESAADVARRAKLSKSLMSFFRAYARLPEEILEVVRRRPDKFGSLVAYQLLKLYDKCGVRKALALANKFAEEEHTRAWLINQAQIHLSPSESKAVVPLKQIRYGNGSYKQLGDKFEVSIAVAEDKRESFAMALEALLETVAEKPGSLDPKV